MIKPATTANIICNTEWISPVYRYDHMIFILSQQSWRSSDKHPTLEIIYKTMCHILNLTVSGNLHHFLMTVIKWTATLRWGQEPSPGRPPAILADRLLVIVIVSLRLVVVPGNLEVKVTLCIVLVLLGQPVKQKDIKFTLLQELFFFNQSDPAKGILSKCVKTTTNKLQMSGVSFSCYWWAYDQWCTLYGVILTRHKHAVLVATAVLKCWVCQMCFLCFLSDLPKLTVSVPVPCQHDVVFMKLLPAVVLSWASLVITVPGSRILSTNGRVESTAAFWPGIETSKIQ